jgi:dipeptidase D
MDGNVKERNDRSPIHFSMGLALDFADFSPIFICKHNNQFLEAQMASSLSELKPELLWKHFQEILKIPHCSKNEKPLGDYVLSVAEKNGCEARRDEAGNVVIVKPATPGHEKAPGVVLQGHLDMVCEKNSDVEHDFSKDPIQARIEGEWVTAEGTTLGADNGIGVAAALAVLEDSDVVHGPLELLFTTDEETGLNGANSLTSDFLKGRILLNLDSEEEGAFSIGCAGGADSDISLPVKREKAAGGDAYKIALSRLRGGHSGIDIHTGRGNAVQLLARMLFGLEVPFRLVGLEGGNKHNAIPREAFATVILEKDQFEPMKKALEERFKEIRFEFKAVEKDMAFSINAAEESPDNPMADTDRDRFLALAFGLPHGVQAMSQEIDGLVETSNNVAIVRCKENEATVYTSTRSSILSALEAVRARIEAVSRLSGARIKHLDGYPAWTPNLDSKILATMKKVYKSLTGKDAHVMAIHAGLECGIIGEKYEGMDMISFGPELKNPHSPDEKVHFESVGRFWKLLLETLKELA